METVQPTGRSGVGPPRPGRVPGAFTNPTHIHDLFYEDAQRLQRPSQPWWRVQLFVWEPVLFGTWDGVFTTCMINIFGVVLFLRTGFLVGNTGVLLGMLLVSVVVLVALVTVMSGIGLCERCGGAGRNGGGVYSMVSTALGGRVGGTVGLLYVFGQCVAGAMYLTGFSESVAEVLGLQSQWAVRAMSAAVLLALLGINLAGVKWIVRLQLLLLALLAVSTLDFVLGTFTHLDPGHGFVGYTAELLGNNSLPDYSPGENFFTVFGVFFPAATGVMAGFNMSSDLQRPEHNIPLGTLAAVFTSWFLYLVFVFLLGAICTREALRYDFLIAEKVSLVGFLFLLGLYISSLASCMGGLYGAPRILQCVAQERVVPALAFLGKGRGPNRTPVAAICLTSLLTMAFIFIGRVNVLAPIVTINFMLTYSVIDYSYFSVAMTAKLQARDKRDALALMASRTSSASGRKPPAKQSWKPLLQVSQQRYYGSGVWGGPPAEGTLLEFTRDMDRIFGATTAPNGVDACRSERASSPCSGPGGGEERCKSRRESKVPTKQMLMDSFGLDENSNVSPLQAEQGSQETLQGWIYPDQEVGSLQGGGPTLQGGGPTLQGGGPTPQGSGGHSDARDGSLTKADLVELDQLAGSPINQNTVNGDKAEQQGSDIRPMPDSFYASFCNHWVALIGALGSLLIMFVIQWVYALANISVALMLFLYIGKTSPGLPMGAASRFSFFRWLKSTLSSICRRPPSPRDQIVVTPSLSGVGMETRQLTEDNADFSSRHRYHQSSFIEASGMVRPRHD